MHAKFDLSFSRKLFARSVETFRISSAVNLEDKQENQRKFSTV